MLAAACDAGVTDVTNGATRAEREAQTMVSVTSMLPRVALE